MTPQKWIIFYIELGEERIEERIPFPVTATGTDIQKKFEQWREEKLVSGWWKEETYNAALAMMQKLTPRAFNGKV